MLNSKKKSPKLEFLLPAYLLDHIRRLEAKRCNTWSPNFATITHKLTTGMCLFRFRSLPSAPCSFFYLKDYGHLHITKP